MGEDEEATLRTLTSHRRLIDSQIEQHHGRFVNSAGDSVLAEFASVVEAVNCAVEIQTGLKAANAKLPPERRMELRVCLNRGAGRGEGGRTWRHLYLRHGSRPGARQAGACLRRAWRAGG